MRTVEGRLVEHCGVRARELGQRLGSRSALSGLFLCIVRIHTPEKSIRLSKEDFLLLMLQKKVDNLYRATRRTQVEWFEPRQVPA